MAPATRRAALAVSAALVILFGMTELVARGYRAARQERAESHAQRAEAYRREGRLQRAAEEYRAALTFAPGNFEHRLALARILSAAGQWREAERHLVELREADPSSGAVNLMLARIDAQEGRWDAAVESYHRAIFGYWPEAPLENRLRARLELAGLYHKLGDRTKLLAELLEAAAEAPPDPDLRNPIGRLLLEYGAPQQAADIFRETTRLDDAATDAWVGLGEAERTMGNYRAAVSALRSARRRDPDDPQVARLLEETVETMRLDPTRVRLSGAERNRRSREVVKRALEALERCGELPEESAELAEAARKALAARRPRRLEGETPRMLALAEELWRARRDTCPKMEATDVALELTMARIMRDAPE